MYNLAEAGKNSAISYWANQPTDQPWLPNGFAGTFAYSDHRLIPETITEFLLEHFRSRVGEARKNHISAIPLEEINDLMNEVWEGPGSMVKIVDMTYKLRHNRLEETDPIDTKDVMKGYIIPTFDSNLGKSAVD
ncbi:hypothetical protein N9827_00860 [bacterium]|nr:hypothetical protein [bacterium]